MSLPIEASGPVRFNATVAECGPTPRPKGLVEAGSFLRAGAVVIGVFYDRKVMRFMGFCLAYGLFD